MTIDELTAARIRSALRELEDLDPAMVETLLADPQHGPLLREALAHRIRWTCPLCDVRLYGPTAPAGWLVVEPFTRVASCDKCRPALEVGGVA